jgi:hypothetical protein
MKFGLFTEGGRTDMKQEEKEENYINCFVTVPSFTKKHMGKACNVYVGNWNCINSPVKI